MLVYNHLLDHSNRHLFGSEQTFSAPDLGIPGFATSTGISSALVPTLEPDCPGGYRPIDWDAVDQQAQSLDVIENQSDKFLVIDEGQDMPPAFYRTLTHLGFENFYVAADQNQQIHPDKCSSRQDIENTLAIESDDTLELKNQLPEHASYRAARPALVTPADPASPKPGLPDLIPAAATPELWAYGTANTATLAAIAGQCPPVERP